MRHLLYSAFLLLPFTPVLAQNPATDTIIPAKGDIPGQLKAIRERKIAWFRDSAGIEPRKLPGMDYTKYSRYGDLLNDDPEYTKKSKVWRPAAQVVVENTILNIVDRTVMHLQFAKTDVHTWSKNLRAGFPWTNGWEWDQDRFGNNFLSHPMMGSFYFSAARTNGYNFWASFPIVFAGSYMWKIFGENGTPEREDLINTTVDGELLGEVTYRLSSNILDDRATGPERVFREILAGLIDPVRGVNRLFDGHFRRHVNKEIYQKEPVNIALFVGAHSINTQTNELLSGHTDEMVNVQLNYGNPFERRSIKPFDYFKFRAELNFGVGRKIVDNITGYGALLGKTYQFGRFNMLVGGFQHYDYYDAKAFELSTIAFGPGVISRLHLARFSDLDLNLHVGYVPFAGSSVGPVTDTSFYRDYRFAYGWEAKVEAAINISKYANFSIWYYYYFIHAFDNTGKDDPPANSLGNNYIGVLKPRLAVHVYRSVSVGLEENIYWNDHYQANYPALHYTQTEQRIFVLFNWEDRQRRGHYYL
ncbi:MAG TPA: DUF3943 domain-containing protein [Puia sp.]|nr:DUF3943 domain-containing protein [Puia sp.]